MANPKSKIDDTEPAATNTVAAESTQAEAANVKAIPLKKYEVVNGNCVYHGASSEPHPPGSIIELTEDQAWTHGGNVKPA